MSDHVTPARTAEQDQPERWLAVVGFESLYEVSNAGRVRRVGRAAKTGKGQGGGVRLGRILKQQRTRGGYRLVFLWKDGKQHGRLVHVLVAAAFIGPCPDGMEVNHKDGDKTNNTPGNLEYLTRSDNMKHAYAIGIRLPAMLGRASSRRIPRVMVPCKCGCGTEVETPDEKARPRRYVNGHRWRKKDV